MLRGPSQREEAREPPAGLLLVTHHGRRRQRWEQIRQRVRRMATWAWSDYSILQAWHVGGYEQARQQTELYAKLGGRCGYVYCEEGVARLEKGLTMLYLLSQCRRRSGGRCRRRAKVRHSRRSYARHGWPFRRHNVCTCLSDLAFRPSASIPLA